MTPEEFSKKALEKLKVFGVELNAAEKSEALEWLKTQYKNYGKLNYAHGYEDGSKAATELLDKLQIDFKEDE